MSLWSANLYTKHRRKAEELQRHQEEAQAAIAMKKQNLYKTTRLSAEGCRAQKSYYDYVNEYRVNEFKRVAAEVDVSKYTLTALSQMCGFSSRATFFRHFKAVTGITPAEYLKRD